MREEATLGGDEIHALIVCFQRQFGNELEIEADSDLARVPWQRREQPVVESTAAPEPRAVAGEGDARHEDKVDRIRCERVRDADRRLANSPGAGTEFVQ